VSTHRAHLIKLKPTAGQAEALARAAGTARFAYNWGLSKWQELYAAHQADPEQPKPSEFAVRRLINATKREEFPWMLEVTKYAPEEALRSLGRAYANFFAGRAKYPKFKKKGRRDAFRVDGQAVEVDGSAVKLPKLGWVRMREDLRFSGKIISATISRRASGWFVALTVETESVPRSSAENQGAVGAVGIDLGLHTLAALSTGEKFDSPKAYAGAQARLRRLQKSLSRKVKGSENRKKAAQRVGRLHERIANIRQDALHKLTTHLADHHDTVVIEDLHVKGMVKNSHLAKSLHDASFGEFRRQLEYKVEARGGQLIIADRWFPSSKTCSCCGGLNAEFKLSERSWTCSACGAGHDRDINAAKNLLKLAVGATVTVCGEGGAGSGESTNETTLCEAGS
jgi:putative transposase